jgi:BirA family biotin operon repressor/biotin-[acetyl-CoA-carboxylase] ligase
VADPEILSLPAIIAALDNAAHRFDVDLVAVCASTNGALLTRADAPSGTVILALQQTAGRGRMGRAWFSAPGDSLTFSLLHRFPSGTLLSGLSLAVGIAVSRALDKTGLAATSLKWPNDILKDGRKLGGILIEMQSNTAAVIGIGINVRLPVTMPAELSLRSAALDRAVNPNALLATLLIEIDAVCDDFATGGFVTLRDEWLARHAWAGCAVRVMPSHGEPTEGTCVGVADDGALLLDTSVGIQRILSGDVSLRQSEAA